MKYMLSGLITILMISGCKTSIQDSQPEETEFNVYIPDPPSNMPNEYWQKRVDQINVGSTTRREVEQLLPVWYPWGGPSTGSSQAESYWVDEDTKVIIFYDYTGSPQCEDPTNLEKLKETLRNKRNPSNKVLQAPVIEEVEFQSVFDGKKRTSLL